MGKTPRTEHKENQTNWEISMRPETFPQILSIGIWAPQEASTPLLQELEESKQHHHHSGWGTCICDAFPLKQNV